MVIGMVIKEGMVAIGDGKLIKGTGVYFKDQKPIFWWRQEK